MQKKIVTNLLQQNCYIRESVPNVNNFTDYGDKVYNSLVEKPTKNGFEVKIEAFPYPITPQYVNSFVDSADYRRDPANAIANAPKRTNLGDVTELQSVVNMDFTTARKLYNDLKSKFENVSASTSKSTMEDNLNG